VAALAHVAIVYWRPLLVGEIPLGWGRDLVWMAPLSYLVAFAVIAALVVVIAALVPRRVGVGGVVGTFAFFSTLAILLLVPSIHQYASLILALGVGVQAGRVAAGHAAATRVLLRRTTVALTAAFVVLAAWSRGSRAWSTSRAMAALPPAPRDAPNVLLIILDTVRGESLSLYGYPRATTPALDRLAEASVVFDSAMATGSWTLPTHGTLLSGHYVAQLAGNWVEPVDGDGPRLAELFGRRGYATGAFVANVAYTSHESGLARGFATYDDFPITPAQILWSNAFAQTPLITDLVRSRERWQVRSALGKLDLRVPQYATSDRKRAPAVNHEFLSWQSRLGDRPFFAFLNFLDAHDPYPPPPPYDTRFSKHPTARDSYDAAIAYLDSRLQALFAELADRGVLDNTLVVVTGDHGEHFGEWGLVGHGNSVYPPVMQVPLLMRFPGHVPAGERVGALVSLRDVPRTIARLALGDDAARLPGVSLTHAWSGRGRATSPVVVERHLGRGARDSLPEGHVAGMYEGHLEYARNADGTEELIDLRALATDSTNLASNPAYADALSSMRVRMDSVTGGVYAMPPAAARAGN
jgi:arylsulfatase A-like enzyme